MVRQLFWLAMLVALGFGVAARAESQNSLLLNGEAYDLSHYEGKVLILDFWASWCGPCRQSFLWMNEMLDKYAGDGLAILAVNLDKERSKADQFLRDVPANFDVVFDPSGTSAEQLQVMGMPSTYIFNRDGSLKESVIGFSKARSGDHEQILDEMLGH